MEDGMLGSSPIVSTRSDKTVSSLWLEEKEFLSKTCLWEKVLVLIPWSEGEEESDRLMPFFRASLARIELLWFIFHVGKRKEFDLPCDFSFFIVIETFKESSSHSVIRLEHGFFLVDWTDHRNHHLWNKNGRSEVSWEKAKAFQTVVAARETAPFSPFWLFSLAGNLPLDFVTSVEFFHHYERNAISNRTN